MIFDNPVTGGTRPIGKRVVGGDGSSALKVAINGDATDANYLDATLYGGTGGTPAAGVADLRVLGSIANNSAAAGKAGGVVAVFLGYSATVFNKSFVSQNWSTRSSTRFAMIFHGERLNTEAITSLTLSLSAGNFMTGCAASLYGFE